MHKLLLILCIITGCTSQENYTIIEYNSINSPPNGDLAYYQVMNDWGLFNNLVVSWKTDGFNCANGRGWCDDGITIDGNVCNPGIGCVDGGTNISTNTITVGLFPGQKIHETALVHELCHRWLTDTSLDLTGDPSHTGICFIPIVGKVAREEYILAMKGL